MTSTSLDEHEEDGLAEELADDQREHHRVGHEFEADDEHRRADILNRVNDPDEMRMNAPVIPIPLTGFDYLDSSWSLTRRSRSERRVPGG